MSSWILLVCFIYFAEPASLYYVASVQQLHLLSLRFPFTLLQLRLDSRLSTNFKDSKNGYMKLIISISKTRYIHVHFLLYLPMLCYDNLLIAETYRFYQNKQFHSNASLW